MKFLPLIWMNIWRRRIRTTFTLLSIFIAFMLFGIVMAVRTAFTLGVDIAGLDRLVLINKVTLIIPLPISYAQRIQQTPGVEEVTHQTWFNGAYQAADKCPDDDRCGARAVSEIYPEFKLPQ